MCDEIKEKYFPIRHDAEDEIFIICMSQLEEFPEHITKLDDIIGRYDSRYVSESYKNLNLDSVRQRKDKSLINIEHHSNINPDLMRRDYEYCISIHAATKKEVQPFIFYSGKLPVNEVEYANDTMFYNPVWNKTRKTNGNIILNSLKYKIEKQEECNAFDIIDLIWLPSYNIDLSIENTICECIKIYKYMITDEWLSYVAKKCLKLWVGRYIESKNQIKKAAGGLGMSALELKSFEEQLANVIYANRLEQAENRGREEGKEQGETNIIKKLLENKTPSEISEQLDIPLEKIENIQKSK